jgi:hypothetical protein
LPVGEQEDAMKRVAAVIVVGMTLSGCAITGNRVADGAIVGGATGAVIGAVATGTLGGTAVGAGIGALTGAAIAAATTPY